MNDLTPRAPTRPLIWPDAILDLADFLAQASQPVYMVGGSVRDAYFGMPLHDVDLVTPDGAASLARRIADFLRGDVFVMDAERDVARVLADTPEGRLSIDVAAFRASDLLGDLTERDFTLNAMAVDLRDTTMLIDPLDGESDLKRRLLRRCTPHAIATDPIRGLRAVRQSVQLNAHIEKSTMLDVRANARRLYETSPERVRDEFFKILSGPRPQAGLRVMTMLGLLAPILPDVTALSAALQETALRRVENLTDVLTIISPRRTDNTAAAFGLGAMVVALDVFRRELQAHLAVEWPNERPHRTLLHLTALLRDTDCSAEAIATHLRLSNPERARLAQLLKADFSAVTDDAPRDALAQHRYWHTLGTAGVDAVILALADYMTASGVEINQDSWVRILERARVLLEAYFVRHAQIVAPPPFIDGNALMRALKLTPGPIIRELLDHLREQQVTGGVTDADSAFAAARAYLGE